MENQRIASELLRLAKSLVGGRLDNLTESQKEKIYDKTQKVVDRIKRKFPKIRGIQVLSDWSHNYDDMEFIHLGDAAEGGQIDELPAADKYAYEFDPQENTYEMGVHKKLVRELKKHGYDVVEWYDSGTLMAYK